MYSKPSRKNKSKQFKRLNLIPILDSVFIFIFFLLMSANFVKIFEISSDVPIISESEPPKDEKEQLNLTLKVHNNTITLHTGTNEKQIFQAGRNEEGEYDLYSLREKLIALKKSHTREETIVFMSNTDISYEELVKIMDAVRDLKATDPEIWIKSQNGGADIKILTLFNNIIFGDTQS